MPRRPLHLRWIYVKDHALLFVGLTAASVAVLVLAVLLVEDPARGLLLGITPTFFSLLVWAFTNRAGYPERVPETLAHQRTAPTDGEEAGEVSAWDPFELDRPVGSKAPPAPTGNAPTTTPAKTTESDAKPARPATGPKQETTGKTTRHPDPDGPGQKKQKPATTGKPEPVAEHPTPSGTPKTPPGGQPNPDTREKPDRPVAPRRPGKEKASPKPAAPESGNTATGNPGKVRHPNPSQPHAQSSSPSSPVLGQAAGKPAAPTPPGDKKPSRRSQKDRKASAGDHLVSNPPNTPPAGSDTPPEHLTPAEAAKRDAEARKSKKRKGKPDEAA